MNVSALGLCIYLPSCSPLVSISPIPLRLIPPKTVSLFLRVSSDQPKHLCTKPSKIESKTKHIELHVSIYRVLCVLQIEHERSVFRFVFLPHAVVNAIELLFNFLTNQLDVLFVDFDAIRLLAFKENLLQRFHDVVSHQLHVHGHFGLTIIRQRV